MRSMDIDRSIKKNIMGGKKIPHSTSQPVIHEEDGKYYLSAFVFFTTREDLSNSVTARPTMWCISDMVTGEILHIYSTKEKEFSDASYEKKYSIKQENEYNTSKEYYIEAFSVLDEVIDEYMKFNTINRDKYDKYMNMILANIPKEHQQFFKDLSI